MTRFIDPDRAGFKAFADMSIEGRVQMLNLLRLKEHATYDDGREMTGAEAYEAYGAKSAAFFAEVGGKIIWRGVPKFPFIGPSDETWDLGFIAEYPSKDAFLKMVSDPGYQAIVFHRQAAVETSRLYCFAASDGGGVFG